MNINPSDTDVRQGFSLAEGAAAVQVGAAAQLMTMTQRSAGVNAHTQAGQPEASKDANALDERSQTAAANADRVSAREAASKLEKQLKKTDTGLRIRVLDDSQNRVQVEIVDARSDKVIRKIPQDEILKLSASIKEMTGVLLDNPA